MLSIYKALQGMQMLCFEHKDKNRGAKEHDDNKNGSIKTQLSAPLSKMKNSNKYFLR